MNSLLPYNSVRYGAARWIIVGFVVITLAFGVSACGRKGDPAYPDGATYPEEYPTE